MDDLFLVIYSGDEPRYIPCKTMDEVISRYVEQVKKGVKCEVISYTPCVLASFSPNKIAV